MAAAPLELVGIYHSNSDSFLLGAETLTVIGVLYIMLGAIVAWLAAAFLGPAILTKVLQPCLHSAVS